MPVENKNDTKVKDGVNDVFKSYSTYARHLFSLIKSDLFADVHFEVEGEIIPAHRNILVYRSEYFKNMIGLNGRFKEAFELNKNAHIQPIYIKDISYDVFMQVINYLYTGHLYDHAHIPFHTLLGLMKAADMMNLCVLEKLCLFHLSEMIHADNVIKIYKEAYESPDVLKNVISMCHDVITTKFSYISRGADFCSLPQEPMLKIIESVVPRLTRLNSEQVNDPNGVNTNNAEANSPTDDLVPQIYNENSDSDDYED